MTENVKRFYLPQELSSECPKCGKKVKKGRDEYLMYPPMNEVFDIYFYSEGCPDLESEDDCEWSEKYILKVELIKQ